VDFDPRDYDSRDEERFNFDGAFCGTSRDPSDAVFFRYAAVMLTFHSSTRGVVPRFRNKWFAGSLKLFR
jgi:hypothetical protein